MKQFLLLTSLLLFIAPLAAETILHCKSANGKPIFTDDPRKCGKAPVTEHTVELKNTHNQYGALESKEYFNYANRAHTRLDGYAIAIIVESELLSTQPELTRKAADRLSQKVAQALAILPAQHRAQFNNIRYYIFSGTGSSYGGKDSGLWYFAKNNRISKRFDDSIVVNSAANFMAMSDKSALAVIIHELAHGFHRYHWRRLSQLSQQSYTLAKQQKLYTNLQSDSGRLIEQAYALKNHREYFAELSAKFFAEHFYPPTNRQGLKRYDPQGYRLMETAWFYIEAQ
ncbi:hypothetical protein QWY82_17440 [Simiduia curdlanivorans]|uniref:Anthrax toxin lethal/endema factor N-/C-terminal domain-containing protein n=1 Tax=Simiduia curdlanivorans TaxID=1492769 RepID=A0ABV8V506_9GAMM|nr:hypothetical protein [Simiduia curdlanivorans]MDN3640585.1 hypothetical protein [Simiduia curdlanivorans]